MSCDGEAVVQGQQRQPQANIALPTPGSIQSILIEGASTKHDSPFAATLNFICGDCEYIAAPFKWSNSPFTLEQQAS